MPSLQGIMNQNLVVNALKAVWNSYQSKKEMTYNEYEKEVVSRFNILMHIEFRMLTMHLFNVKKFGRHSEGDIEKQDYTARERSMMHPPRPSTKGLSQHDYDTYTAAWGPTQLLATDDATRSVSLRLPRWHLPPAPQPP